jgi:hypothetical protein
MFTHILALLLQYLILYSAFFKSYLVMYLFLMKMIWFYIYKTIVCLLQLLFL